MVIYCTARFKFEYLKLIKLNAYRHLEEEFIETFFNRTDDFVFHGVTIVGNKSRRVIKKRIGGRGGFRVYFYAYISDSKLYLSYIYPKAGPQGKVSLNKQFETLIISETADAILGDRLFVLTVSEEKVIFG